MTKLSKRNIRILYYNLLGKSEISGMTKIKDALPELHLFQDPFQVATYTKRTTILYKVYNGNGVNLSKNFFIHHKCIIVALKY